MFENRSIHPQRSLGTATEIIFATVVVGDVVIRHSDYKRRFRPNIKFEYESYRSGDMKICVDFETITDNKASEFRNNEIFETFV